MRPVSCAAEVRIVVFGVAAAITRRPIQGCGSMLWFLRKKLRGS
jgi:hypothetical protein